MRTSGFRRLLCAVVALCAGLGFVACSLPAPCFERTASCPPGLAERVRAALVGDASSWADVLPERVASRRSSRLEPPTLAVESRTGDLLAAVRVERDPDLVRVIVWRFGSRPTDAERERWLARVDDVCARVAAACPEIGDWEQIDDGSVKSPGMLLIAAPIVLVAAIVVAVQLERRRKRRAPPEGTAPSSSAR